MAKLIVHNPPTVKLKASGYTGTPTGSIELTENHKTYNVKPYAEAETNIPDPVLIEKEISANGIYRASEDNADGYKEVNVNLPFEEKEVTPSTIQQEVEVTPNTVYQALGKVVVKATPLESAAVTPTAQQQTITPTAPAIGFNRVIVAAVLPQIPIAPDSLTPLEFGVDSEGFYYTDEAGGGTAVCFGRDAGGLYVTNEVN